MRRRPGRDTPELSAPARPKPRNSRRAADQHVRGQGGEAAGDQPDVHVVDTGDAGLAGEGRDDVTGRGAFGRGFEQAPGRWRAWGPPPLGKPGTRAANRGTP